MYLYSYDYEYFILIWESFGATV
eukprot:SAG31_NODE_34347_length_334_cov_0.646809_1_plen_22_part_01